MININSNVADVIKAFEEKKKQLQNVESAILRKVAENIKQRLLTMYSAMNYDSEELLSLIDVGDIEIEYKPNSCRINIGSKTETITMADGSEVNPFFFIEFGFGLIGEQSPTNKSKDYNWVYNVHKHKNGWYYTSKVDGATRIWTQGYSGANAFDSIINNFNNICNEAIREELGI